MNKIILAIFIFSGCNLLIAQQGSSQYRVANKFHLEGDGFWDYISVNDSSGRLFISHGTMVQVVDASTGNLIGTITDTKGIHGVAIANAFGEGYTSNGRDSSVTVFELSNLEFVNKITINGVNPDAILFDPFSQRVFTFNGGSSNMSVINAKTNEFIESVPLEGKPEFAVTDAGGNIYVNIEDKNMIDRIDPDKLQVLQNWPITPGEEPSGLAIDNENRRLFTVCRNKLMIVLDADDGHIVATLPVGERVDGVAFDYGLRRVFSSNGDGTLTVIQEIDKDNFQVLENVQTQKGARTCVVYQKNHHIYLPTSEFDPPPEPTPENPRPRATIRPGSFVIIDVEPIK